MHKKTKSHLSHEEYLQFIKEIIKHDKLYYQKCTPEISDYEYDQLVKKIEAYEKEHPQKIASNSPTQRIGEVATGFKRKKHIAPMLSLANTYSEEEVKDFVKRVYKLLDKTALEFALELKMDGTAIALRYEKGKLVSAVTRGDGTIGDDVTNNIKTISSIPLQLHGSDIPDSIEIRGEVFMNINTFHNLNKKRKEEKKELFANPRNAAAGSLKLLNPKEVAKEAFRPCLLWDC